MLTVNSVKEFLKPCWRKIIIVIVLIFLATSVSGKFNKEVDNNPLYGPIGFFINNKGLYKEWGFPLKWLKVGGGEKIKSYYSGLVIDLTFWFLVSCLLIFGWDKIKNKK